MEKLEDQHKSDGDHVWVDKVTFSRSQAVNVNLCDMCVILSAKVFNLLNNV